MFGLQQKDLTGRFGTQMGLPFGNSNGVRPSIPSSGAVFGGAKGSFTSRDDGISYMGWNTQATIAREYKLLFDIKASQEQGIGADKFSRGQLLFLTRETQYERRPQTAWFGHTLSTLNCVLGNPRGGNYNNYLRYTQPQAHKDDPIELDWSDAMTSQQILERYSFMGVMDVVKPVGSVDSILVREGANQIMVNCIVGGRVPQCFNYWSVLPPNTRRDAATVIGGPTLGVREHLYMWLLLHPVFQYVADDPNNPNDRGRYRYFWQYAPVCTFHKVAPSYTSVFGHDPLFAPLADLSVAIPVGCSSFIDDREPKRATDVTGFTYPYTVNHNIDTKVVGTMPQLTLIVDHQTGC